MPAVIDHQLAPELLDKVLHYAPFEGLMVLRGVSRGLRRKVEAMMMEHVALGTDDLDLDDESSFVDSSEDSASHDSDRESASDDSFEDSAPRDSNEANFLGVPAEDSAPRNSDEGSSPDDSDDSEFRDSDKESSWGDSDDEGWMPHDPRCALRQPAPPFRRLPMTYRGLLCKRMRALLQRVKCVDYYGIDKHAYESKVRFYLPRTVVVRYMGPVQSMWLDLRANTIVNYRDHRWNADEDGEAVNPDPALLAAHGGRRVIHYLRVCADDVRCLKPVHWSYPWDRCMRSVVLVVELYDRPKPADPSRPQHHPSLSNTGEGDVRWGFLSAVPSSAARMLLRGTAVTLVGVETVPPEMINLEGNVIDQLRTAIRNRVQHYSNDDCRFGARRSVGHDVDRAMALLSFDTLDHWRASPTSDRRETEKPPVAEQWIGWHPNDTGIYADYDIDVNKIDVHEGAPFRPLQGESYEQSNRDDKSLASDSTESVCSLEIPDPDYSRRLGKKRKDWEGDGYDSDWPNYTGPHDFSGTESDTSTL